MTIDPAILRARDALWATWAELGPYYAEDRANAVAMPLLIDATLDPYIVMHDTLEHGRLGLGLVLRPADVERLARLGADAWKEALTRA